MCIGAKNAANKSSREKRNTYFMTGTLSLLITDFKMNKKEAMEP
jgi:hypothetical protein